MEPDLRHVLLHRDHEVVIHDVICRAHRSGPGAEECATRFTISVPRRGVFVQHGTGSVVTADVSRVLLFWPGRPYRVSHPAGNGDDCTALGFEEATVRDAADRVRPGGTTSSGAGFASAAECDAALFRTVQRLRQGLRGGVRDVVAIEEAALAILGAVLARARSGGPRRDRPCSTARRDHRRLAEATREAIAAHFQEPLRLADLARHARVSPFHLAHTFREITGTPVHRHLRGVRLRAALARVAAGDRDLTSVALDCGFSSHSHMTNAFRREFGSPPSRLRTPPTVSELRSLRKILQARPAVAG